MGAQPAGTTVQNHRPCPVGGLVGLPWDPSGALFCASQVHSCPGWETRPAERSQPPWGRTGRAGLKAQLPQPLAALLAPHCTGHYRVPLWWRWTEMEPLRVWRGAGSPASVGTGSPEVPARGLSQLSPTPQPPQRMPPPPGHVAQLALCWARRHTARQPGRLAEAWPRLLSSLPGSVENQSSGEPTLRPTGRPAFAQPDCRWASSFQVMNPAFNLLPL